ncbi:Di-sulfide bridge nucleocytoplasmic transport domain protein [Cryptosporidium meleagridis]|uniref:Di-sulfide bridge nucleocytoplasmic transport domain protein n=1 Tax=Cryptosporidium meleagridis TaxID=93969 RepID=A0A2P4YX41_9CRYT|nr:Di-sulfide bridge nucleocytoplasmic transport domain protein [Cryptosporidium meleagridis]
MSNTALEELEIEELSKKLMLKLSPKILKEEKFEEDMINSMIIDESSNNLFDDNFLTFDNKKNSEYIKTTDFTSSFKPIDQKLDKENNSKQKPNLTINYKYIDNNCNEINQTLLNRSNSLPPRNNNNFCKGLNLLKKREIKATNNDLNSEKLNYNSSNQLSHGLNQKSYINSSKRMNIENTHEFIRLIFNIIIVFITLYIIFGIIFVIKNDIESKIQISITNILDEMNICSKHYVDNKCHPEQRVPAMESKCTEWERCMSQNPTIIARKSIFTAQIIGEIINTFLDQISFKSALFIFGFIIALIIGNYFVLSSKFCFNRNVNHTRNSLESTSIIKKN